MTEEKSEENPEQQWLTGIAAGDARVLRQLYEQFAPAVIAMVRSNSGSREDGEDLFEEVVVALWRKVSRQPVALRQSFSSYLLTIARRRWIDELRRRKTRGPHLSISDEERLKDEAIDEDPLAPLEEARRFERLDQAFNSLSALCRQIIRLKREGLSARAIGERIDRNENAVNQRFSSCMKRWKQAFEALNVT